MQPEIKNDLVYLLRMLESAGKIHLYSDQFKNPVNFFDANDQQHFNASLALLMNIGEQSVKLSDELKNIYSGIEWEKIKNFRNRIAHDYTGIDRFITYEIIKEDLPRLEIDLQKIITEQIGSSNFDMNELLAAKGNQYYAHVDFDELPE